MWVDNIKLDFIEIRCGAMDWYDSEKYRNFWKVLTRKLINLSYEEVNEPYSSAKYWEIIG
jgi:hypothetical protein